MAEFRRSVEVDCPVDTVFEWHRDTRNAALISPPSLRVVEVEGTFPLNEGDEVSLLVRPRGLPAGQRLRIRIAQMRAPRLIVDEMLQGPFRRWHHEHAFRDLGGGRTRITDNIHYELPLHLEAISGASGAQPARGDVRVPPPANGRGTRPTRPTR